MCTVLVAFHRTLVGTKVKTLPVFVRVWTLPATPVILVKDGARGAPQAKGRTVADTNKAGASLPEKVHTGVVVGSTDIMGMTPATWDPTAFRGWDVRTAERNVKALQDQAASEGAERSFRMALRSAAMVAAIDAGYVGAKTGMSQKDYVTGLGYSESYGTMLKRLGRVLVAGTVKPGTPDWTHLSSGSFATDPSCTRKTYPALPQAAADRPVNRDPP